MPNRIFKKHHLIIVILLISCSCNRSNDTTTEEITNSPTAVILTFPENNAECNEGVIVNDYQSSVNFQWNDSEFTDNYTVVLKNLDTNTTFETESTSNSADIVIDKSTSYQWYVISKSEFSNETAESELWQFYNAGIGTVNHVPFPANLIAPKNDNSISQTDGKIILKWSTIDIDKDIKEYEVFFGKQNATIQSIGITIENEFEVNVMSETEYFWMIKTIDEVGNISTSDVFNFIVN